jgi:hypothetical protein
MAEKKPAKKGTQKSAKSSTVTDKAPKGFTNALVRDARVC